MVSAVVITRCVPCHQPSTTHQVATINAMDATAARNAGRDPLPDEDLDDIDESDWIANGDLNFGKIPFRLLAASGELGCDQHRAACCLVSMTGGGAAVDDDSRVAANNDRCAPVAFFRTSDFVTHTRYTPAMCIRCGGAAYDCSAMVRGVADYDEWSCHMAKLLF